MSSNKTFGTPNVVVSDEMWEHYTLQKQILDICTRSDDTGGYFAISDSELDKLTELITQQTTAAYKKGYMDGGIAEIRAESNYQIERLKKGLK